ncbi:MAG: hypothetical protein JXD23_03885 [Spirochaetales bacterium]|nr:hypothetical protein [Spirochaetales bacterium]
MNKIFSSSDADALERLRDQKQRDIRKPEGKPAVGKSDSRRRAAGADLLDVADEVSVAGNRLTLRYERTLQGLLAVRTLLEEPEGDREAGLTAIIDQTRFQDEAVLSDYAKTLRFAVSDSDRIAIDYLIRIFQDKLQSSARDQIIRENLQAASSLMPDELLKGVVNALRSEGLPQVSIARQRAIELLRAL